MRRPPHQLQAIGSLGFVHREANMPVTQGEPLRDPAGFVRVDSARDGRDTRFGGGATALGGIAFELSSAIDGA
jgi:hypothetical protein